MATTVPIPRPSTPRRLLRWTAVCTASAAPSYIFGWIITAGQSAGMAAGVVTFILVLTMVDIRTAHLRWRRRWITRRTLGVMYGTRVLLSFVFPLAIWVDLSTGFVSVRIVGIALAIDDDGDGFNEHHHSFVFAYLTTCVQGTLMHIIMAVYGSLVMASLKCWDILAARRGTSLGPADAPER